MVIDKQDHYTHKCLFMDKQGHITNIRACSWLSTNKVITNMCLLMATEKQGHYKHMCLFMVIDKQGHYKHMCQFIDID